MEEYSKHQGKVEQFKKDLLNNSGWNIYYDEEDDDYLIQDLYGQTFPIDIYLRELLPNSYFHSPECDEDIIGYDPITGRIVYDLWRVGKKEMMVSEAIYSDFGDTAYGIGKLLNSFKNYGFGDKIPPIHIMPRSFIFYQNDLQEWLNYQGPDFDLYKIDISEIEGKRLKLSYELELYKQKLENKYLLDEDIDRYQRIVDNLVKQLSELK